MTVAFGKRAGMDLLAQDDTMLWPECSGGAPVAIGAKIER